jgi:hypothetical protein
MELTGTIKEIFETQQISEKFKKREFVLTETSTQYPQDLLIQCTQEKCNVLDMYKVGDGVNVSINLRGRGYEKNGKTNYFNSIEAWKIAKSGNAQPTQPSKVPFVNTDDLPF